MKSCVTARAPDGFALVLTLGLVALTTLLLLAVVSFSRVELRAQENMEQLALARRNALFALRTAVARLQNDIAHAGSVTVRADYLGGPTASASWTGTVLPNSDQVSWLVNGPEHGRVVNPANSIPLPSSRDASSVVLLHRGLNSSSERVVLLKSEIREYTSANDAVSATGRYAYWASDESLKVSLGVRTNLAPPLGRTEYPYPRIGTIFPAASDMQRNNVFRSRMVMTDQALVVRLDDSLPTSAFPISATALTTNWPHVTAKAFALEPSGAIIEGAFNVNSRSTVAWRAVLGAVSPAPNYSQVTNAILAATRPFRDITDFEAKVGAALGIGGATEISRITRDLAPTLRVRGETFLVRAYGETLQPLGAPSAPVVRSSAICEALVQRKASTSPAHPNGRFEVVYLRWLNPDEV